MQTKQFVGLTVLLVIVLPWAVRSLFGSGLIDGMNDTIVTIIFILLIGLWLHCFAMPGCLTFRRIPRLLGCLFVCFVLSYLVDWALIRLNLLWGNYFELLFVARTLAPLLRALPYLMIFLFLPKALGVQPKATCLQKRTLILLILLSLVVFLAYEVAFTFSARFSTLALSQWMYDARDLCLPIVYISVALFPQVKRNKVDAESSEREDVPTS